VLLSVLVCFFSLCQRFFVFLLFEQGRRDIVEISDALELFECFLVQRNGFVVLALLKCVISLLLKLFRLFLLFGDFWHLLLRFFLRNFRLRLLLLFLLLLCGAFHLGSQSHQMHEHFHNAFVGSHNALKVSALADHIYALKERGICGHLSSDRRVATHFLPEFFL